MNRSGRPFQKTIKVLSTHCLGLTLNYFVLYSHVHVFCTCILYCIYMYFVKNESIEPYSTCCSIYGSTGLVPAWSWTDPWVKYLLFFSDKNYGVYEFKIMSMNKAPVLFNHWALNSLPLLSTPFFKLFIFSYYYFFYLQTISLCVSFQ